MTPPFPVRVDEPREWMCAHPQPVQYVEPTSVKLIDVQAVPIGKPCPKCHAMYGDTLAQAELRRAFARFKNDMKEVKA